MFKFYIVLNDAVEVKVYNPIIMPQVQTGRWHNTLQPSVNNLADYLILTFDHFFYNT